MASGNRVDPRRRGAKRAGTKGHFEKEDQIVELITVIGAAVLLFLAALSIALNAIGLYAIRKA